MKPGVRKALLKGIPALSFLLAVALMPGKLVQLGADIGTFRDYLPSQTAVLISFCVVLIGYIVWIDLRPVIAQLWARGLVLTFDRQDLLETYFLDHRVFRGELMLAVKNSTRHTIKEVSLSVLSFQSLPNAENAMPLGYALRSATTDQQSVTLNPGQRHHFRLGLFDEKFDAQGAQMPFGRQLTIGTEPRARAFGEGEYKFTVGISGENEPEYEDFVGVTIDASSISFGRWMPEGTSHNVVLIGVESMTAALLK